MRQVINPDGIVKPVGYSQAVRASGSVLVFIAGQVAVDENGEIVGRGDIEAQTRQIMINIETIIKAAGGTMRDIVRWTHYSTNIARYADTARRVRSEFIPTDPPAGALIEVKALAHPDYLLEVDAIAVLD